MTDEKIRKGYNLKNSISSKEIDIKDLETIIDDYKNFGSTLNFKRNSDGYNRGFGSKTHKFKEKLTPIIIDLLKEYREDLVILKSKYKNL